MAEKRTDPIVIGGQTVKGRIRSAAWKWAMASLRKWLDLACEIVEKFPANESGRLANPGRGRR